MNHHGLPWELKILGLLILLCCVCTLGLRMLNAGNERFPEISIQEKTFTGTLGLVEYEHSSLFGFKGGVTKTTLTFHNNSGTVVFAFNKDLPVSIGQTYTVTYSQKDTLYYNATAYPENATAGDYFFGVITSFYYSNTTEIKPLNIILTETKP